MKYVSRQAMANAYVDSAFCGYNCMVVDLEVPRITTQGILSGGGYNFHAINFNREQKMSQKKVKKSRVKSDNEEVIEIPDGWPDEICYYYNRRKCYGRCARSHICRKCKQGHRDIDCRVQSKERKN